MQATEGIKGPVNRLSQGSRKKSSATSGLTSRGRGGGKSQPTALRKKNF